MIPVAVLLSDALYLATVETPADTANVRECYDEFDMLQVALRQQGIDLQRLRWREAPERAGEFAALLPLLVWDYFEGNEIAFLESMELASRSTRLINSLETIRWNSSKLYLQQMQAAGAATIQTLFVDRVEPEVVERAFDELQSERLVIKPTVGGGSWRQVLYQRGQPFPKTEEYPPGKAMIQSFLPSVAEEGEYSFLFFGGKFSHSLVKRPKPGDYRIQSAHGGREHCYQPSRAEIDSAAEILSQASELLDETPLYARVDLIRGRDGKLKLIEIELLEPYLYLPFAQTESGTNQGAKRFADALAERLS